MVPLDQVRPDTDAGKRDETSDVTSLYRAARDRAARFRLLAEMGKDFVAARGLDALLRLALEQATAFTGYDGGSVLLFGGPEGALEVRASLGADAVAPGTRVTDRAGSVAWRALQARRPLLLDGDGANLGMKRRAYIKQIPSAICLPLITSAGQPIGVLALKSTTRVLHLAPPDLDALQLLGAQLAAAVESAQLHERLERRLDALRTLHKAGQGMLSSPALREVGLRLLDIAKRLYPVEAAAVSLRNEGEQLRVWQTVGPEKVWRWARGTAAARVARRKASASGDAQCFALPDRAGVTPGLVGWCLPLRVQQRVIGHLEVYGPEPLAQTTMADTLGSLASQAAVALENARLSRELAESERRWQSLVGQLVLTQEEERRRLAYTVQDGLAQLAASAHVTLQAFARHHRPRSPQGQEQLDRALELAQRTVEEAHRVIAELQPTTREDFGQRSSETLNGPAGGSAADGAGAGQARALRARCSGSLAGAICDPH